MQDRFKFRLYDKAIGEMAYDVCVGFIKDYGKTDDWVCTDTSRGQITYRGDRLKAIVLMQCIGLKDHNGKLIYEGDIVADVSSGCVATIEYLPSSYSLMAHIRRMDEFIPIEDICFVEKEGTPFEVIGNIYENPELLEEMNN